MTATCHGVVKRTGLVCSSPAKWVNNNGIPMCGRHVRNGRGSVPIANPKINVVNDKHGHSKVQTRITQFMKPDKDNDCMNQVIVLTLYMTCACMCMNMLLIGILIMHSEK